MNRPSLVATLCLGLVACGDDLPKEASESPLDGVRRDYTVQFSPLVAGAPFACGQEYSGVGLAASSIRPLDFRMYVHNVQLVRANGEKVAFELEQDRTWQKDAVALLDFEDGTAECETGSPQKNESLRGSAPSHDDYAGLEFDVGIPREMNHLDAAVAPAPFNAPGMWWSWTGGYKFLRLDFRSTEHQAWYIHLGATGCSGSVAEGFNCDFTYLPHVVLSGFDPTENLVSLDAASLLSGSNPDIDLEGSEDMMPGCMSNSGDPECGPLFERLGLRVGETTLTPETQTFFGVAGK